MAYHPIPERISRVAVHGLIMLTLADLRDAANADHQPANAITERMALLRIEDREGFVFGESPEHHIEDCFLPLAAEYPWGWKRRRRIDRKRVRRAAFNLLLATAQHPVKRHGNRRAGGH